VGNDLDEERAVLGDELQQRGDPQGELIALQLAMEALPSSAPPARRNIIQRKVDAVLDQHHDALYGPLARHVMRLSKPDLENPGLLVKTWRRGFADAIWLQRTFATHELVDLVRAIRTLPIARFVRRLELAAGNQEAAVAELAREPFPSLRELVCHYTSSHLPSVRITTTRGLDATKLELLELKYVVELEGLDAPLLRRLELYNQYNVPATRLLDLELPTLEDLTCSGFRIDSGFIARYPALRRLSIQAQLEPGWFESFLRSSAIERMETISIGTLTDADLLLIRDHAARLARVKRFDLMPGYFSTEGRAAVAGRLPSCVRFR
jgi:hypothetical protein